MPTKNKERDDLNNYRIHFLDGSSETFHSPDKVIQKVCKGEYHPLANAGDEWMINLSNVLWIENVTPIKKEDNND